MSGLVGLSVSLTSSARLALPLRADADVIAYVSSSAVGGSIQSWGTVARISHGQPRHTRKTYRDTVSSDQAKLRDLAASISEFHAREHS